MLVRRCRVSGPTKVTDIVSTDSNRHLARIAHSALLEGVPAMVYKDVMQRTPVHHRTMGASKCTTTTASPRMSSSGVRVKVITFSHSFDT